MEGSGDPRYRGLSTAALCHRTQLQVQPEPIREQPKDRAVPYWFPSSSGLQDSPTSVTPPPVLNADDLPEWANNPFTYSSQELATLFGPSLSIPGDSSAQAPPSPTTFIFRAMSESPQMFEAPPSPPDSLSDQEGYLSSSGSISGSESPVLDTNKRLPIFSRLSISDD
ncbi:UNVERIFIED_CONTAM: hypothetical protein FKN15_018073 [Acipenser sinensis]